MCQSNVAQTRIQRYPGRSSTFRGISETLVADLDILLTRHCQPKHRRSTSLLPLGRPESTTPVQHIVFHGIYPSSIELVWAEEQPHKHTRREAPGSSVSQSRSWRCAKQRLGACSCSQCRHLQQTHILEGATSDRSGIKGFS